jgi:hypothetical protein
MKTLWILPLFLIAASCGPKVDVSTKVTRRAPAETFNCVAPRLAKLPFRTTEYQTADGWRMDIQVFSGPPAGWYRKGSIEHSDGVVVYAPDGATLGIASDQVMTQLNPILRRCSR